MPVPLINPTGSTSFPMITCAAKATMSTPSVLEMKGKERETRTLHSITFSWSSCGSPKNHNALDVRLMVYLAGFVDRVAFTGHWHNAYCTGLCVLLAQ